MYLRLKFTSDTNHFNTVVVDRSISTWIQDVLIGSIAISALPSSAFDIANCEKIGSLPTNITVTREVYNLSDSNLRFAENWLGFTKTHSQNNNFVSLFRIYQNQFTNVSWQPRLLSSNATNVQPSTPIATNFWHNETNNVSTTAMTHGVASCEMQFFISSHWVIWSIIDGAGRGGTAGIYDVESTGQDVWARAQNSLYSPQIFISAYGQNWPSTSTRQVSAAINQESQTAIYSNLMYNGDNGFTNRGGISHGVYSVTSGPSVRPLLYPDTSASMFSTRDEIGDTQNYMIPVYCHPNIHYSTTVPVDRAILNGRIPFLWRTTDNAGQTGQTATVGGTEYRFVRLHATGTGLTISNLNSATYMVPTTIGGV